MTAFDILYLIRNEIYYCFVVMRETIIFDAGTLLDFPITLFDIFLGFFISNILSFIFLRSISDSSGTTFDDDDYRYNFNYNIFEEDYDYEE